MKFPTEVRLREVAPRDGFQSLERFVPTEQKIEIIEAVGRAGVAEVEATSFVSPRAVPQMRDAQAVMAGARRTGCVHAALVPNLGGAQRAVASRADQLVVVISASEAHNRANLRRSRKESLADLDGIFRLAESAGVPVVGAVSVAFGCPYEGDVSNGDVLRVLEAYLEKGAAGVMLADTAGMATPLRVERLVALSRQRLGKTRLILHFHNNRGTAMANLLAAMAAGVSDFDTALGGIGGCPFVPRAAGNLATEDVVFMLEDMGIHTGIDLDALVLAARKLEAILGFTLPGQVMKSGPRPGIGQMVE
jgi:hydroxymethylglutaryl-CoA lyase